MAQKPMPYAFSRTLQVFKHFRIPFMVHFMTRNGHKMFGVIMGDVVKSASSARSLCICVVMYSL